VSEINFLSTELLSQEITTMFLNLVTNILDESQEGVVLCC